MSLVIRSHIFQLAPERQYLTVGIINVGQGKSRPSTEGHVCQVGISVRLRFQCTKIEKRADFRVEHKW